MGEAVTQNEVPKLHIDMDINVQVRDSNEGMIIRKTRQSLEQTIETLNTVLKKLNPDLTVQIIEDDRNSGNGSRR